MQTTDPNTASDDLVASAARVLTLGDSDSLMLPLLGEDRTIERHLKTDDPHCWRIICGHMETINGFVDAVFAAISGTDGVCFRTSELASLLLGLPGGESLKPKLEPYLEPYLEA